MAANLPIKQLNRNVADTEYLSWLTQLATAGQDIDIVEVFVFLTLCICPGSLNLQQDKTSIRRSIVRILGTSSIVSQNHIAVCIGRMVSVFCANTVATVHSVHVGFVHRFGSLGYGWVSQDTTDCVTQLVSLRDTCEHVWRNNVSL